MAKKFVAEYRVSDDTLAFDVIRRAANTGSYLLDEHTVGFVRKEM